MPIRRNARSLAPCADTDAASSPATRCFPDRCILPPAQAARRSGSSRRDVRRPGPLRARQSPAPGARRAAVAEPTKITARRAMTATSGKSSIPRIATSRTIRAAARPHTSHARLRPRVRVTSHHRARPRTANSRIRPRTAQGLFSENATIETTSETSASNAAPAATLLAHDGDRELLPPASIRVVTLPF